MNGGYVWGVGGDDRKQAYGHAFVLLAASSAKVVGHPDADRLLADVTEVLKARFWEPKHGASREEFARDWSPISHYRGQNSNMHLTEATMAAFEATGDRMYLDWAESIATLIISQNAAAAGWQVPEHYDEDWRVDRDYAGGDVFRPFGITPGHSLEWTRLILQLWELGGRRLAWLPNAAASLFRRATPDRLGQGTRRLPLHARLGRQAASPEPPVVAGGRGHRRRRLPQRRSTARRNTRSGTAASGTSSPTS